MSFFASFFNENVPAKSSEPRLCGTLRFSCPCELLFNPSCKISIFSKHPNLSIAGVTPLTLRRSRQYTEFPARNSFMLSSQDRDFGYSTAFKDSAMLILPIRRFIKKLTATANNIVQTNAKRKLRGVIRIAKVSKSITTICITIQWTECRAAGQ